MILSEDQCWKCGRECVRVGRSWWQRIWYVARYECPACKLQVLYYRFPSYWFSFYRRCPQCGDTEMKRHQRGDAIEKMYRNPISLLQVLVFAPLWNCRYCRMDFFDLRPGLRVRAPKPVVDGLGLSSAGDTAVGLQALNHGLQTENGTPTQPQLAPPEEAFDDGENSESEQPEAADLQALSRALQEDSGTPTQRLLAPPEEAVDNIVKNA
jgi:hypothetical protein